MKRSVLLSAILFGSLFYNSAKAQISIHFGFNIPARPVYAPVPPPPPQPVMVYDNDDFDDSDDYYYLPEVEAYYSIPRHCYYYMNSAQWVSAAYLPGAYRNYDWRTFRHYEVRASRPYFNHDVYRNRWGGDFNRGRDWSRRSDVYANRPYRGGWNGGYNRPDDNRGGWNRPDDRRDNNWGRPDNGNRNRPQPNRDNNGGWGRGQQPDNNNRSNNGGWGQPRNNGGGWDRGQQSQQPDRGNGGGWNQPGRSNDSRTNDGERGNRGNRDNGGNRGFAGQLAQNNGGVSTRPTRF
ncbi:MAG: hypothetical protein JKY70_18095 [Mucilaginibacter sp.]|nr:hypothetical protein [Mucilaginibacter sp.]